MTPAEKPSARAKNEVFGFREKRIDKPPMPVERPAAKVKKNAAATEENSMIYSKRAKKVCQECFGRQKNYLKDFDKSSPAGAVVFGNEIPLANVFAHAALCGRSVKSATNAASSAAVSGVSSERS